MVIFAWHCFANILIFQLSPLIYIVYICRFIDCKEPKEIQSFVMEVESETTSLCSEYIGQGTVRSAFSLYNTGIKKELFGCEK